MKTVKLMFTNWLDNLSQKYLSAALFLSSTGAWAMDMIGKMQAYGAFVVTVLLVGAAQVMKMYRDHLSWKREELRKEQMHEIWKRRKESKP